GEEGAELVGPMCQGQEDVRHEAGLLLNRQDALADVVWQGADLGDRETADGRLCHGVDSSLCECPTGDGRRSVLCRWLRLEAWQRLGEEVALHPDLVEDRRSMLAEPGWCQAVGCGRPRHLDRAAGAAIGPD